MRKARLLHTDRHGVLFPIGQVRLSHLLHMDLPINLAFKWQWHSWCIFIWHVHQNCKQLNSSWQRLASITICCCESIIHQVRGEFKAQYTCRAYWWATLTVNLRQKSSGIPWSSGCASPVVTAALISYSFYAIADHLSRVTAESAQSEGIIIGVCCCWLWLCCRSSCIENMAMLALFMALTISANWEKTGQRRWMSSMISRSTR